MTPSCGVCLDGAAPCPVIDPPGATRWSCLSCGKYVGPKHVCDGPSCACPDNRSGLDVASSERWYATPAETRGHGEEGYHLHVQRRGPAVHVANLSPADALELMDVLMRATSRLDGNRVARSPEVEGLVDAIHAGRWRVAYESMYELALGVSIANITSTADKAEEQRERTLRAVKHLDAMTNAGNNGKPPFNAEALAWQRSYVSACEAGFAHSKWEFIKRVHPNGAPPARGTCVTCGTRCDACVSPEVACESCNGTGMELGGPPGAGNCSACRGTGVER